MKIVVSLAALLAIAVTSLYSAPARAESDHLIVPWQRIGPVSLGMSADDVVRVLGEPTQKNQRSSVTVYYWKDNLTVTVKTDGSYVTEICALSPDYATAQGLRARMSDKSVTALMGEPQNSHVYRGWWKLSYVKLFWGGLVVSVPLTGFDNDNSVQSVCVNHNA